MHPPFLPRAGQRARDLEGFLRSHVLIKSGVEGTEPPEQPTCPLTVWLLVVIAIAAYNVEQLTRAKTEV
jgi:hypothetical protein